MPKINDTDCSCDPLDISCKRFLPIQLRKIQHCKSCCGSAKSEERTVEEGIATAHLQAYESRLDSTQLDLKFSVLYSNQPHDLIVTRIP